MSNNFRNKLYKFFYGRNGVDSLNKFIFVIYMILFVVSIFIKLPVIAVLELMITLIFFYRFFSRDISRRSKENQKYLKFQNKITGKFKLTKRKWKDRKTNIYKKCPKCKTVLRLPLKKGRHICACPKCNNEFKVRCFRNAKIEVINGGRK